MVLRLIFRLIRLALVLAILPWPTRLQASGAVTPPAYTSHQALTGLLTWFGSPKLHSGNYALRRLAVAPAREEIQYSALPFLVAGPVGLLFSRIRFVWRHYAQRKDSLTSVREWVEALTFPIVIGALPLLSIGVALREGVHPNTLPLIAVTFLGHSVLNQLATFLNEQIGVNFQLGMLEEQPVALTENERWSALKKDPAFPHLSPHVIRELRSRLPSAGMAAAPGVFTPLLARWLAEELNSVPNDSPYVVMDLQTIWESIRAGKSRQLSRLIPTETKNIEFVDLVESSARIRLIQAILDERKGNRERLIITHYPANAEEMAPLEAAYPGFVFIRTMLITPNRTENGFNQLRLLHPQSRLGSAIHALRDRFKQSGDLFKQIIASQTKTVLGTRVWAKSQLDARGQALEQVRDWARSLLSNYDLLFQSRSYKTGDQYENEARDAVLEGRLQDARLILEDGLFFKPHEHRLRLDLACVLLKLNKLTLAEETLEELLERNSSFHDVYFLLGEIALRRNRWPDAHAHFNSWLAMAPMASEPPYFWLLKPHRFRSLAPSSQSRGILKTVKDLSKQNQADQARLIVERALEQNPNDLHARAALADVLYSLKNYDAALQEIETLESSAGFSFERARLKSMTLEQLKRPTEALLYVYIRIHENPHDAAMHRNAARLYRDLGDYAVAERHTDEVTRFETNSRWDELAKLFRESAKLLHHHGHEEAIDLLERTLESFPENRWVLSTLGHFQLACGQRHNAEATADRLVENYPDDPRGYYLLTQALEAQRNWDKAAEALSRAMERSTLSHGLYRTLTGYYARLKDFRGVETALLYALESHDSIDLHLRLARLLMVQERTDEAAHYLNAAKQAAPLSYRVRQLWAEFENLLLNLSANKPDHPHSLGTAT